VIRIEAARWNREHLAAVKWCNPTTGNRGELETEDLLNWMALGNKVELNTREGLSVALDGAAALENDERLRALPTY